MSQSAMYNAMFPGGLPSGYNYQAGGTANYGGVNAANLINMYHQDQSLPAYNGDGEAGLEAMMARRKTNFNSNTNDLNNWGYGGYQVLALPNGSYGIAKGPSETGEQPMDVYDSTGKLTGTGITPKVNRNFTDTLSGMWDKAIPLATAAMIGGGIAGGFGVGPFAGSGGAGATGAGVTGFGDVGTMYAGADAASAGTLGGGASVLGGQALPAAAGAGGLEAMVSGQSLGGAGTAGGLEGSALGNSIGVGAGGSVIPGMGTAATGGLGSILSKIGGAITGGGNQSGTTSGINLSDIANILGGAYGAYQQDQSSKQMMDWLNGQQAKIDNLYSPGSAEYNSLWDEMSRKDAAAGRNSQYGPRSVDLAAKIAQIKADNTAKLTQGIGALRNTVLGQGANSGINLTSPIIKALQGSNLSLSSILGGIGSIFGGGGNSSSTSDITDFLNEYGLE